MGDGTIFNIVQPINRGLLVYKLATLFDVFLFVNNTFKLLLLINAGMVSCFCKHQFV